MHIVPDDHLPFGATRIPLRAGERRRHLRRPILRVSRSLLVVRIVGRHKGDRVGEPAYV